MLRKDEHRNTLCLQGGGNGLSIVLSFDQLVQGAWELKGIHQACPNTEAETLSQLP